MRRASLKRRRGSLFAAFLKLLIPLIVVIPGIAALVLAQDGALAAEVLNEKSDRTYGELMKLAPEGLRGLVFCRPYRGNRLVARIDDELDCNYLHDGYL